MPVVLHGDKKGLHSVSGKLRWQDAEEFNEQCSNAIAQEQNQNFLSIRKEKQHSPSPPLFQAFTKQIKFTLLFYLAVADWGIF